MPRKLAGKYDGARQVLFEIATGQSDGSLTDSRQARWLFQAIGLGWLTMDIQVTEAGRKELNRAEMVLQMTRRDTDDPRSPATPAEITTAEQIADERIADLERKRAGKTDSDIRS